jgi:hypothetical protein
VSSLYATDRSDRTVVFWFQDALFLVRQVLGSGSRVVSSAADDLRSLDQVVFSFSRAVCRGRHPEHPVLAADGVFSQAEFTFLKAEFIFSKVV